MLSAAAEMLIITLRPSVCLSPRLGNCCYSGSGVTISSCVHAQSIYTDLWTPDVHGPNSEKFVR